MMRRLFGQKCYDPKLNKVYYLYKSELDDRYIRCNNITDSNIGECWMILDELEVNQEIYHPPLSDELRNYVVKIKNNLEGVYDQSLDDWEVGFRKDRDMEREIAGWLFLSNRFKTIQESMILNHEEKQSLFRMMMAIMNNGKEFAKNNIEYVGQINSNKGFLINKFTEPDRA
jgi:hypothetical protein